MPLRKFIDTADAVGPCSQTTSSYKYVGPSYNRDDWYDEEASCEMYAEYSVGPIGDTCM